MSKVVTTTVLPDVAGGSVTLGGTGDSVVVTGNDIRANVLQDAGGNAVFTSNGSGVLSGMNSAFAGALKLIQTQTVSNQASVSFTTGIDSTYDVYIFKFYDVNPATDSGNFQFQANASGQSGYNESVVSTFFYTRHNEADDTTALLYNTFYDTASGLTTGFVPLLSDIGNGADESAAGELYLFNPASTTYIKHFYADSHEYSESNFAHRCFVGGYFNFTAALTNIQFKMLSGNMDAVIKLYGISKS